MWIITIQSGTLKSYNSIYNKNQDLPKLHLSINWKTRARVTPRADKALTPDIFYD